MLTARDQLENKLEGFQKGADDYLVKPFDMPELVARVSVLAARRSGQATTFTFGNVTLDANAERIAADAEAVGGESPRVQSREKD
ncbi:hypothetical protein GTQ48_14970 [Alteromonas genovensis]|uniref:Response regulatory domain-containing protein n=1 Tax=Alteromonas genovensis TaxID=471225 RepID=A0A6N9THL9_9ALTE|nr:hypothetical protein [Alteromonas genovensis]